MQLPPGVLQRLVSRLHGRVELSFEAVDLFLSAARRLVVVGLPVAHVGLSRHNVEVSAPDDSLLGIELAEVGFEGLVPRFLLAQGCELSTSIRYVYELVELIGGDAGANELGSSPKHEDGGLTSSDHVAVLELEGHTTCKVIIC